MIRTKADPPENETGRRRGDGERVLIIPGIDHGRNAQNERMAGKRPCLEGVAPDHHGARNEHEKSDAKRGIEVTRVVEIENKGVSEKEGAERGAENEREIVNRTLKIDDISRNNRVETVGKRGLMDDRRYAASGKTASNLESALTGTRDARTTLSEKMNGHEAGKSAAIAADARASHEYASTSCRATRAREAAPEESVSAASIARARSGRESG